MMKVTILDNKNLEDKLTLGKQYEVKGESTGDFYDYYLLLCDDGRQHWVEQCRVEQYRAYNSELLFQTPIHTIDLPSMLKSTVQRIICIPDENGHVVDLQRVQYISPLNDGSYSVTLVSGWEIKLMDEVYSREKLIGLWKGLQNKQA